MKCNKNQPGLLLIPVLALMVSGCLGYQTRLNSSVVDYLYPNQKQAEVEPSVPVLKLPLNVGIVFVPEHEAGRRGTSGVWSNWSGSGVLSEAKKTELLDKVAANFRDLDYVDNIEVIPSAYLRQGGGFANLDQIRSLYGIDVIALVSYDQIQFTDEGLLSFTYWTIIGAYVVAGEKNDTHTMLDTAVFDIASQKMLMRAPGISNVKGSSTIINLSEELRKDSLRGFELAADDMIPNLKLQLERLKEKIKQEPEKIKVVRSTQDTGYSGGGGSGGSALGIFEIMLLAGVLSAAILRRLLLVNDRTTRLR